jgi:hypothetical protein
VIESIPQRLGPLITDQLFEFAQQAQLNLGSDDLVVVLDLSTEEPELSAHLRSVLADSPLITGRLQSKLAQPAAAAHKAIQSPHLSFWFLAIHSDEQMDCAALNASLLGPAGHA